MAIETLKSSIKTVTKKIEDAVRKSTGADPKSFKVLMLGGRRCGKTSALALIVKGFNDEIHGDLNLVTSLDKDDWLGEKIQEMEGFMRKDSFFLTPDEGPGLDKRSRKLEISLKSHSNSNLDLLLTDVPGEWMKKGSENEAIMQEELASSNVFIVAIDTPYLMEADGKYNEARNYCSHVCERILHLDFSGDAKKMILFVPLKCEKYVHIQGGLEEIRDRVKAAYQPVFTSLCGQNAKNCVLAITPIVTMGVIQFGTFKRDEATGAIEEKLGIPTAIYHKTAGKTELEPKYCEQLIYYLLAYILKTAALMMNNKKGLWRGLQWFANIFLKMPTGKNWLAQTDWILKQLNTSDDGYELLSDPLHFKG